MKVFALCLLALILASGCTTVREPPCDSSTIITNDNNRIRCFEKIPTVGSASCNAGAIVQVTLETMSDSKMQSDINCEPPTVEVSCSLACIQAYRGEY